MTTPTWQEAITPIPAATYRDEFLGDLEAAGSNVNGWSADAPQRAFVEGESRAMAATSTNSSQLAKTASPATVTQAGDSWVDVSMSWFVLPDGAGGVGRIRATRSVYQITMAITPAVSTLTIDNSNAIRIQAQAQDGTFYLCSQNAAVTLNAATSYRGVIEFTARASGTGGNVTAGQITKIVSAPAGLSLYLPSGTTQTRTVTARNAETSAAYIARGLGRWGTIGFLIGGGVAGWIQTAFNYLIPLYGNNGNDLNVTRWSVDDANPNGPGTVQVTLANADGPATVAEVAAVQAGLDGLAVKPVGSGALLAVAAIAHPLTLNITLVTDGSNPNVAANASNALDALELAFPTGPALLDPDLVIAIAMGGALATATIVTGTLKKEIVLGLPGFTSVVSLSSLSLAVPENVATGEVLVLTVNITVTQ